MASVERTNRSQQILGGRSQVEKVAFARNAMATFERMWGAIRLLSENHPGRSQFLQLFLNATKCYTELFGPLAIEVGPYAFSIDGKEILKIDRPNENYIYRLYQDGIRRLVFGDDLSFEELERFLKVLLLNFNDRRSSEDNIVTLLWEAGLESIAYTAIETFVEAPTDEAESPGSQQILGSEQDPIGSKDVVVIDNIIEKALSASGVSASSIDTSRQEKKPSGLFAKQIGDQSPTLLERVVEETRDRASRTFPPAATGGLDLDEKVRASAATLGPKFGEITFYAVQSLEASVADPVLTVFGDFALNCIGLQSEEPLAQALAAIDRLSATCEGRPARKRILKKLEEPEIAKLLVRQLTAPRVTEGVTKLFELVGADIFPCLWERLLEVDDEGAKVKLRALLAPFAKYHGRFLLEKLSDSDTEIAAESLFMLQRSDFTRTVKDLMVGLGHPSPTVRIEVARTLQLVADPVAHQVIVPHLLEDPDEDVRLAVIRILVKLGVPNLEDILLGALQQEVFARRSEEEKKLTMAALGRVATAKCLTVVRDLALGSGPNAAQIDPETQIIALRLVGEVGGTEEGPALEKIAGKFFGGREVKAAARHAAESIRRRSTRK